MVTSVASSIETSMHSPSPVRSRFTSAAEIANAAVRPPIVSQTGKPVRSGAVSGVPVTLMTPDSPCTIWS